MIAGHVAACYGATVALAATKPRLSALSGMKAGSKLVRWILVVTLGCSLGLLLIYVEVSIHPVRIVDARNIYVANRLPVRDSGFKLCEEDLGRELTEVIEGQLAAFRQDDYPKAYQFAASGLKAEMPLPSFER
ncbi:MAG TPA: DUF4864 domain-containing protein, partial [Verrucomicrobiae bacterium]|nr:DUF4864 domain-containing protein [Verrucomicrobiae bacterium]